MTMNKVEPKKQPFFISFEGGEGAGKTTLIHKIDFALKKEGFEVIKTREPGGSPLGEHIRKLLLDRKGAVPISKMAELMLFLAARAQQIEEVIKPALQSGKVVLCDRFNDSTVAYQGVGRELGIEKVEKLCSLICGVMVPNLTFFLDVDPKVGLSRTTWAMKENAKAGHVDRIEAESLEFHMRLRQAFLSIAERHPERILILNANQSVESVFDAAMKMIRTRMTK